MLASESCRRTGRICSPPITARNASDAIDMRAALNACGVISSNVPFTIE